MPILHGALKTAERMDSKAAGEVFYEVGDALRHSEAAEPTSRACIAHEQSGNGCVIQEAGAF